MLREGGRGGWGLRDYYAIQGSTQLKPFQPYILSFLLYFE